jgi:hypothetical protein
MRNKREFCMVTVKESLEQIKERFVDLFGSDVTDVRLEEVDESNKNTYYLTVSFLIPNNNISQPSASALGNIMMPYTRQYKNVVVNKNNGSIISIKMHSNA